MTGGSCGSIRNVQGGTYDYITQLCLKSLCLRIYRVPITLSHTTSDTWPVANLNAHCQGTSSCTALQATAAAVNTWDTCRVPSSTYNLTTSSVSYQLPLSYVLTYRGAYPLEYLIPTLPTYLTYIPIPITSTLLAKENLTKRTTFTPNCQWHLCILCVYYYLQRIVVARITRWMVQISRGEYLASPPASWPNTDSLPITTTVSHLER